ncbi:MAG: CmpA/NrtA family ABC transporter substrate-binding protein [Aliishimia sp.]
MTRTILNCGYLPLVDCAPLIIAEELGFAAQEGLKLNLLQQPSWSALRDMLALGHLDAAQMLSPMPIAMSLGLGSLQADVHALMVMSVNGTVFGVSNQIAATLGQTTFGDAAGILDRIAATARKPLRIGIPFKFSMHHLLLSYWTSTRPDIQIEAVTVPPPRMADAIETGHIDAFWVGEPWGSVIVDRGLGHMVMTGRDVWNFAPEKVLAARAEWIANNPQQVRRLMRCIAQATRWLDRTKNKPLALEILTRSEHLDLPPELIEPALTGYLTPSDGASPVEVDHFLVFNRYGANFPWRSQAAWIAAQLGAGPGAIEHAKHCFRSDVYRETLTPIGIDLPGASEKVEGAMQHATAVAAQRGDMILGQDAFFDGRTFDFGGFGAE